MVLGSEISATKIHIVIICSLLFFGYFSVRARLVVRTIV